MQRTKAYLKRHAGGLILLAVFLAYAAWMASRGSTGACPANFLCPP